ncbi:MAG: tRNA pseudouridine(38-40) synthase TruA [Paraprevotella sp.]|nr:tRNA pseudouridine(38-40) synthase TruA [Paraprevotella sp.]
MQRYFIYLAYDGARYHGWQVQPNGISVQAVLQDGLSTILRQSISVVGAGRTDAGVHARVMVAHFDYDVPEGEVADTKQWTYKLNRILPPDVSVYKVVPVTSEAHARFSATSRTYHYFVHTEKSPFERSYSCRLFSAPDFEAMNKAARVLFEYIDFTSFSKVNTDVKTNNCRIMKAEWTQVGPSQWRFEIQADRFLRNMVRAVVGTLMEVGRGKMDADGVRAVIEGKNRCKAGESMPGNALFLVDVTYPEDLFVTE